MRMNSRKIFRLRVVSNFGDGDCGGAPSASRRLEISRARARVCISPAPQSPSPKLETTRSLKDLRTQKLFVTEKYPEKLPKMFFRGPQCAREITSFFPDKFPEPFSDFSFWSIKWLLSRH